MNRELYNRLKRKCKSSDDIMKKTKDVENELKKIVEEYKENYTEEKIIQSLISDVKGQRANNETIAISAISYAILLTVFTLLPIPKDIEVIILVILSIAIGIVAFDAIQGYYKESFILNTLENFSRNKPSDDINSDNDNGIVDTKKEYLVSIKCL